MSCERELRGRMTDVSYLGMSMSGSTHVYKKGSLLRVYLLSRSCNLLYLLPPINKVFSISVPSVHGSRSLGGRQRGCQASVQSVLEATRDGTAVIGQSEARTTVFRAREMRTDTLQGSEWMSTQLMSGRVAEWLSGWLSGWLRGFPFPYALVPSIQPHRSPPVLVYIRCE